MTLANDVTCNKEGSSLLIVKTLNLTAEYAFQLEAYIQHLISSRSSLEDPVKVFSEVILEERCQQDFE